MQAFARYPRERRFGIFGDFGRFALFFSLFSVCLASAREVISFIYWRFCTPGLQNKLATSRDLGPKRHGSMTVLTAAFAWYFLKG
jgi:hypothetical protein